MKKCFPAVLLALVVGLCSSCSMVRTLKSESGLYDVPLESSMKASVDGWWSWGKGNPYALQKKGFIYISPMDISKVVESEPERAPLMVPQMFEYVVQGVIRSLKESNAANGTDWQVTTQEKDADIRVDMALVHFRPQRPGLRLLSSVGGHFVKVPGVSDVVGRFAEGDICIELTIRDARNGTLYFACKDSNRKTAKLYSSDAYSRSGNADVNLRYWAERLAKLIRASAPDRLGNATLREKLEQRSWVDVIEEKIID